MKALFKSKAIPTIVCASIMAYTTSCTDESTNDYHSETDQLCFDVSLTDKDNSGVSTRSAAAYQATHYEAQHFDESEVWLITSTEETQDSTLFEQPQKETRGTSVNKENFYDSFNVYAYVYGNDKTWSEDASTSSVYIDNISVTETGDKWYPTNKYFWPGNAYKMAFLGYAPNGDSNLSVDFRNNSLTYTVQSSVESQKDVVLAPSIDVAGDKKAELALTFKHILTSVKVKASSDFTPKITSVKLENVYGAGTYTDLTSASNTSLAKTWNATSGELTSYEAQITDYSGTTSDTDGNIEVSGDGNNATFFMIPQTLGEKAKLVITLSDGTTKEASLSGKVWPEGHTVTYIISDSNTVPTFEITPVEDFTYEGGTNSYAVTSYKTRVSSDGTSTQQAAAWTAEFVEQNEDGSYTAIDQPKWITSFVAAGDGKVPEGDDTSLSYSATIGAQDGVLADSHNEVLKATAAISGTYDLSTNGGTTAMNTANCYIVNAPGTYTLPLVYGNAIKDGATNEKSYTSDYATAWSASTSAQQVLHKLVNHADQDIISPFIEENLNADNSTIVADNAKLVWQDGENLVSVDAELTEKSVTIDGESKTIKYLTFTVPDESIQQGNAVIAVRNASNKILWSWHIWVTDYVPGLDPTTGDAFDLRDKVVTTNSYGSFTFMPINLGWIDKGTMEYSKRTVYVRFTQTGTGEVRYMPVNQLEHSQIILGQAPYWQWGRKDPMRTGNSNTRTDEVTLYYDGIRYSATNVANKNGVSIGTAISNPNLFYYKRSGGGYSCWEITPYGNMWGIDLYNNYLGQRPYTGGATDKTIYDPAPVGYRVPSPDAFNGFTLTGNAVQNDDVYKGFVNSPFDEITQYEGHYGFLFYCNKMSAQGEYDASGGTIYFPALGYRQGNGSSGGDISGIYGNYCSAYSRAHGAEAFFEFFDETVYPKYNFSRYHALSVRPVRE